MLTPASMRRLKGFRFPREFIVHAVCAYDRFALGAQAIAVKDVLCDVQANYIMIHFELLFAPLFIVGCIMTPWE